MVSTDSIKNSKHGVYEGRLKAAEAMLQYSAPEILLDIGCRDSGQQKRFYKFSRKVYIIDLDYEVLPQFKGSRDIFPICGNGCALPYKNNAFDGILCAEVIEHVPDAVAMLKECNRVLKKDGHIIITTPNRGRIANYIRKLIGKEYKLPYRVHSGPGGFHVREYIMKELERDFQAAGFKIISWKPTYFGLSFDDRFPVGTIRFANLFMRYNATLAVLAIKYKEA